MIKLFKKIYKGKWLTTGISKGGQTALFHRAFYPKDVDVSVPYVAPVNLEREDERLLQFFNEVGTVEGRKKVRAFQHLVLDKKENLIPLFKEICKKKGWEFSMGIEKAYELAVLEYPFAFWQWGIPTENIPNDGANDQEILAHFIKGASPDYFTNKTMKSYESFFYQAYKELGYYNYVPGNLKPKMNFVKSDTISNNMFAPGGDTLSFNRNTMHEVISKLNKSNPKMILICGEYDPWGATSLNVENMTNSIKVVKKEGSHKARINNLPENDKNRVWEQLKVWMKLK